MSRTRLAWGSALMTALVFSGGLSEGNDDPPAVDARRDPHSYSNPDQVRVRHVELRLSVDFKTRRLVGYATLPFERQPNCPRKAPLVLDTKNLTITQVKAGIRILGADERGEIIQDNLDSAPYELGKTDRILGTPLTIRIPEAANCVRVFYETSPDASALQWLDPRNTAGGKSPFLFSQSEAIHARSWIPLQDSPSVRVSYWAYIEIPPESTSRVVMSADSTIRARLDQQLYGFAMRQPIPPYLIALAVGDLEKRSLGKRTEVFAEPPVIEKAAWEFADTERMVSAAERLFGPYRWSRYGILVLPPSFPFGGMENPTLTFATPTILAGDRSLVSLVAHELAHSWSGNLVTNATWSDFWLNEGFTTYIERRIVEDLYGPDRAMMERVLGLQELREELKRLPAKDQILHIDLIGRDPDEGMTRVPYEKGALFLTTIEQAFGRERLDAFLRSYFQHFAFKSITTADFEDYLREQLLNKDPKAAESIDVHAWLHEPGLPGGFPEPHSERFAKLDQLASNWVEGKVSASDLEAKAWSTQEWLHFLRALLETLPTSKMSELDGSYHLTDRGNAEIAQQWLLIAIRNRYKPADARLESFLTTIGRRKFLLPLYGALLKTPEGKARAEAIYAKARPFYHPITVESVDKLLRTPEVTPRP